MATQPEQHDPAGQRQHDRYSQPARFSSSTASEQAPSIHWAYGYPTSWPHGGDVYAYWQQQRALRPPPSPSHPTQEATQMHAQPYHSERTAPQHASRSEAAPQQRASYLTPAGVPFDLPPLRSQHRLEPRSGAGGFAAHLQQSGTHVVPRSSWGMAVEHPRPPALSPRERGGVLQTARQLPRNAHPSRRLSQTQHARSGGVDGNMHLPSKPKGAAALVPAPASAPIPPPAPTPPVHPQPTWANFSTHIAADDKELAAKAREQQQQRMGGERFRPEFREVWKERGGGM